MTVRTHKEELNVLTKSIQRFIATNINNYIPSGMKNIYVVGSFSSGEITIIRAPSNELYMSDVDVVVDVAFHTFLKCSIVNHAQKLSAMLTDSLRSRGFKTHVSISIVSFGLFNLLRFLKPQNTVYLYELTPLESSEVKYLPEHGYNQRIPNRLDSLNLIFSSIADYVFAKLDLCETDTIFERTYTIAKRCLTVLYSLLLFKGIYPRTYAARTHLARQNIDELHDLLSHRDLEVLDALVEYKLGGDWRILIGGLQNESKSIDEVFKFLDEYFLEFATKVLEYELKHCASGKGKNVMMPSSNLASLLERYRSMSKVVFPKRFIVGLLYSVLFIKEKKPTRLSLALSSIFVKGLRIDDLLRYTVGVVFFSMVKNGCCEYKIEDVMEIKRMWDLFLT